MGQAEHIMGLHELISDTADIKDILRGVTGFASKATTQGTGVDIDCALTLRRRKRTATVAGSSAKAVHRDHIEQSLG